MKGKAICMRNVSGDIGALCPYDAMLCKIYVICGCIYDICRWRKGHGASDICITLELKVEWHHRLGMYWKLDAYMIHVFNWLYIGLSNVVCLSNCYTIYYLCWVLLGWWNSLIFSEDQVESHIEQVQQVASKTCIHCCPFLFSSF